MPYSLQALRWLALTLALSTVVLQQDESKSRNSNPQISKSKSAVAFYFPPDTVGDRGNFFAEYLARIGEPSLLASAQDSRSVTYRLEGWSAPHARFISVRLYSKSDRHAQVLSIEQSGSPSVVNKAMHEVDQLNLQKFFALVENSGFWSMSATKQTRPTYNMDATVWVIEGVHDGQYHVVLRETPLSSAFTDVVRFMGRDLAKLDPLTLPRTDTESTLK